MGEAQNWRGGEHVLPVRVYYEDTDAVGIVYHANYLRFAERARTEMMRALGLEQWRLWREHGLGFAVRRCCVDYHRPAQLDDALEIRSRVTAAGGASLSVRQAVTRDGASLAELDVRIACIDRGGRAVRLPPHLREALTRLARGRPPGEPPPRRGPPRRGPPRRGPSGPPPNGPPTLGRCRPARRPGPSRPTPAEP